MSIVGPHLFTTRVVVVGMTEVLVTVVVTVAVSYFVVVVKEVEEDVTVGVAAWSVTVVVVRV